MYGQQTCRGMCRVSLRHMLGRDGSSMPRGNGICVFETLCRMHRAHHTDVLPGGRDGWSTKQDHAAEETNQWGPEQFCSFDHFKPRKRAQERWGRASSDCGAVAETLAA